VARLVEELSRQGYTLLLGSNTNELHATHFRRKFAETLAHFRHLVLSYEVGHIKPAREFFHACTLAAAAEPERCIFIDDLAENIEGARAAGLKGLVFQDVPTLVEDLRALGVRIEPADSLRP
jgi:putative hydrolase of the HAD superfamily